MTNVAFQVRSRFEPVRALVIDDDEGNRALMTRLLGRCGVGNVCVHPDARTIEEIVDSFDPHLVFVDMHLPGIDGLSALERLTLNDAKVRSRGLILVSGAADEALHHRAGLLGVNEVLSKPFTAQRVRSIVESLLALQDSPTGEAPRRRTADPVTVSRPHQANIPAHEEPPDDLYATNRELREANERLREASAAKSEFLSRLSHELRTPLTSILGYSELLALSEQLSLLGRDEQEYVSHIRRAGSHLLELVNDALDIAKIESGQFKLSLEPVAIGPLVQEVIELATPLATGRGVVVEPFRGDLIKVHVRADNQRLRQVLLNLLSNAIKYNRPHGMVISGLEVSPDERVRVTVTDQGPGLTTDQIKRLFVPFERLGSSEEDGTGLGLAVSRQLIDAMHGTIGVSSSPGHGSVFWIELPITEPAAVPEPIRSTTLDIRWYAGPRRILYAEDMVTNVRLIEEILKRRPSVTLIPVMLGRMALDLARERSADLLLLDRHLPDMSGDEVLQRLSSDPATSHLPVIILSADANATDIERLAREGAAAYLTKPIKVERFLDLIDGLLGSAES